MLEMKPDKEPADGPDPAPGTPQQNAATKHVRGIGVSGGVAIGQVVVLERFSLEIYPQRMLTVDEIDG